SRSVTDETPATPQAGQESQPDHTTSAGARLGPVNAAQSDAPGAAPDATRGATFGAAPQRAAAVTAPLSADQRIDTALLDDAATPTGAQNGGIAVALNGSNGANGDGHGAQASDEATVAPQSSAAAEASVPDAAPDAAPAEDGALAHPAAAAPATAPTADEAADEVADEIADEP